MDYHDQAFVYSVLFHLLMKSGPGNILDVGLKVLTFIFAATAFYHLAAGASASTGG